MAPSVVPLLLFSIWGVMSLDVPFDTSTCRTDPEALQLEPVADFKIGVILNAHDAGSGLYGCGRPSPFGIHAFESFRSLIQQINRRSMSTDGESRHTALSGITLGLNVYDSCGHPRSSVDQLTSLFPILKTNSDSCVRQTETNSTIIGAIDLTSVTSSRDVSEALREMHLPFLTVPPDFTASSSPDQVSKILEEIIVGMEWTKLTVLYDEERTTANLKEHFKHSVEDGGHVCVTEWIEIPDSKSNRPLELRPIYKTLMSLGKSREEHSAILVLGHGLRINQLLKAMGELPQVTTRLQWLFSSVPDGLSLVNIRHVLPNSRIMALSPYPGVKPELESRWSQLSVSEFTPGSNDQWFYEYASSVMKGCSVRPNTNDCDINTIHTVTQLDALRRTSVFLPVKDAMEMFVNSLRSAWLELCEGRPGSCPRLKSIGKQQFIDKYFSRQKKPTDQLKLALTQYTLEKDQIVFNQVAVYHVDSSEIKDTSFRYMPSKCFTDNCKDCGLESNAGIFERSSRKNEHWTKLSGEEGDLVIPLLLPIHRPGASQACGTEINEDAIQDLEAALWITDRINSDESFLQGARLGIRVIDTCASPTKIAKAMSALLDDSNTDDDGSFPTLLTVISSLSPGETSIAGSILAPSNVTFISAHDASEAQETNPYILQIPAPSVMQANALVDLIKSLGWDYVSVIYSPDRHYKNEVTALRKGLKSSSVCTAFESAFGSSNISESKSVVGNLQAARDRGSRGVVLLTDTIAVRAILNSVKESNQRNDFVWLAGGEWTHDLAVVKGLEEIARGAVLFSPAQSNVAEFVSYYKRLKPESNTRNPFFAQFWKQSVRCQDSECDPSTLTARYKPSLSVGYVMQAILSVAAGLARARNELCGTDTRGLCPRLLLEGHLRQVFNHYLRYTASVRPDGKGEMFSFTREGHGNTDVDLFNFRRANGGSYIYQKVGSYRTRLSSLLATVAYDQDGREIAIEKLVSTCTNKCFNCQNRDNDVFFVDSPDHLYIAASFNLHESSDHPLQCGAKLNPTGIRRLEAFLWALQKANEDVLRKDLTLGAVIFDACFSPPKSARDLSNFITRNAKQNEELHLPAEVVDSTLALLTTADSASALRPLLRVTDPLEIPTVSLASTGFPLAEMEESGHLLKYSLPDDAWARATLSLMKTFRWSYVSVVKSQGEGFHKRIFEIIKDKFSSNDIRIATVQDMPLKEGVGNSVDKVLSSLTKHQKEGARVVILLTNAEDTESLLSTAQRLQKRGQFQPNDFLLLGYDHIKIFQKYNEQALGALSIRPEVHQEVSFIQHFSKLTPNNGTRNPWFRQFWEQENSCQGPSCVSKATPLSKSLRHPDPMVTNVIQSVLSVATATASVLNRQCSTKDACLHSTARPHFRQKVFERTKDVVLIRPDGTETAFGNKNYIRGKLEVLNFRQIGSHSLAFVTVGTYSEATGLSLNSSNVKGYTVQHREYPLTELTSRCLNSNACLRQPKSTRQSLMYVNREEKLFLGALLPIHTQGSSLFTCGPMGSSKIFHNVIALVYSLARNNIENDKSPAMGAVIFDDCNQQQRAEQKIYSFFAEQAHSESSPHLISMLAYNDAISDKIMPILEAKNVPLIIHPSPSRTPRGTSTSSAIRTTPYSKTQMNAVLSVLQSHGWRYVYVIHPQNAFGEEASSHFKMAAKQRDICVAETVAFKTQTTIHELGSKLKQSFTDPQPRVVILITEDPFLTRLVLKAAKESSMLTRFVWIGTEGWGNDLQTAEILEGSRAEAITVSEINPPLPGLQQFYSNLTLARHEPIPDDWFEEYWQHTFECRLIGSRVVQLQYPEQCTGQEKLKAENFVTKDIFPTVATVQSVAETLEEYNSKKCPNSKIRGECGIPPEKELVQGVRKRIMELTNEHGFNVYRLGNGSDGTHTYTRVGTWKEGATEFAGFPLSGLPASICLGECSKCTEQMSAQTSAVIPEQGPIYANFQTVWGIVGTALSVLGIVLVIICTFYFLMAFPVTVGTTVLGYKILFGLLILYGVNFAFILSPTESTCGVRRFVMGLAYSVIFSGLLIKVMNTWRLMGYSGGRMMNDPNRMSSPAGLLVVSVGLVVVQIILTSAWLVLMPPKTGFYQNTWRCAPPNSFEDELVISLIYVMLILAVTILFSVLTWKCKDNGQESRWILACCVFVGLVWLIWTVLGTQLPLRFRDATIVVANLLCATLVMLCLYMRKVYVYSKLSRQMRRRDLKSHLKGPHYQHSMYGTLQKNLSAVAPVLCGSQASLTGKAFYGSNFGHVELDETQSETCGSTGSAGSVQVQGTDLYPLEMYDGGSHLSLYGAKSMLAMGDNNTYER